MRIEQRNQSPGLEPLKFALQDCPHAVIETNRDCNMHCKLCYNLEKNGTKSLGQVRGEIDAACRLRRLQAISLVGGEPTLHPQLPEIIGYVKSRGLICQVITNGLKLLQDQDGSYLERLISAGVDKLLIHVDQGQSHVYHDIEATRKTLFDKLEARGVPFALSITIYQDGRQSLPGLARRYAGYRHFEGILAILARDPLHPDRQNPDMLGEYRSISDQMEIEPSTYVPSNLDDRDVSWLIYLYYINAETGRAFGLSPTFNRIFRSLYKLLSGKELFAINLPAHMHRRAVWVLGLLETLSRPRRLSGLVDLLRGSTLAKSIRFHYLVIQDPPEFDPIRQQHKFCYHCPDATIRNGQLTPVCVADQVNPLRGQESKRPIDQELQRAAYQLLHSQGPRENCARTSGRHTANCTVQ